VKGAVDFVFKFEHNLVDYCKRKFYEGVVCGHIHSAEIRTIEGIQYLNTGDFVESCTAIVEHYDGRFEIITWDKMVTEDEMDIDSDRS
jgi:UDP-2,3-diacylglucosamine pyrophosphatase LpxH